MCYYLCDIVCGATSRVMTQQGTTTCCSFCWKVEGGNGTHRVNDSSRWQNITDSIRYLVERHYSSERNAGCVVNGCLCAGTSSLGCLEVTRGDWYHMYRALYMHEISRARHLTLGSFVALKREHGLLQWGPAVEKRLLWVKTRCFQIVAAAGRMLYVLQHAVCRVH